MNEKIIIIADTHFGIKRFSLDMLDNQLKFFIEEVFPYMEANNINTIWQLGDLFDNRTTADIIWLETLKRTFFNILREKGFILHTLLGNHDIAKRESRDISLIETLSELYPDNFKIYKERTTIDIFGNSFYIVPWIVKGEDLTYDEIKGHDYILGHFEIRNFSMVKGHIDETSPLTTEFFEDAGIKGVYSGHYHLKNVSKSVKYLGTPFQLNWSDYNEEKGFYTFDEFGLEFFPNTVSKKYVKIKYNDEKNTDRNIEVSGLFTQGKLLTDDEFKELLPELKKHDVKFFINKAKDRHFDEVLYTMKDANIKSVVVDNQELSEIIGTDYIADDIELDASSKDTRTLITDTVKENRADLLDLLVECFQEVDSTILKEI